MAAPVVMVFRFASAEPADKLRAALEARELQAAVGYARGAFEVHTNTRCLEHAAELVKLIGGAR